MNTRLSLLIILTSCVFTVFAQPAKENLRFAKDAYNAGDYYSAAYYYALVIEQEPNNIDAAYWLADASRLSLAYKDAEKWYELVKQKEEAKNYGLLKFNLGSVNKSLGNYEKAFFYYNEFLNEYKDTTSFIFKKAKQEVLSCLKAKEILKDTLNVNINRLENTINTPYSEFNAFPLGDSVLYFSSLRPTGKEKSNALIQPAYTTLIYKSNLQLNGWSEAKEIDSRINTKDAHNANITFSNDYKTIYFSRCYEERADKMHCNLFKSRFENNRWSTPEKLNNRINVPGHTATQPAYGKNEKMEDVLFFVSDRPGGMGGMDLWYAVIKGEVYNEPINLGSFVNTPGDEISPFYHSASQTLYFSSDWIEGLGGYDIFKTKGYYNNWSKPENMGYPINTSFNDMYFVMNEDYPEAYLTSNRPGSLYLKGETCCNDVYYVKFNEIKKDTVIEIVEVVDSVPTPKEQIEQLLPLTLYFHNDEPDPATNKTETEFSYEKTLEAYSKLIDTYVKEYSEGLTGEAKIQAQNDIKEFFDSYVMKGFDKLQRFASWLTEDLEAGNTVQITIRGYCSPLNRGQYNVNLSKRRISSLVNFIKTYDNAKLMPYLEKTAENGGRLDIFEEPLGDAQSAPFVSNNPHDARNSIYSRVAALERKVEIVMYTSGHDSSDLAFPEIAFRESFHDFGNVKKDDKKTHIFIFKNTGKANLLITSVETTSSAIVTQWEAKEIMPHGTGVINILFDAKNLNGNINEKIYVTGNTNQGKILLEVKAVVE